jgi:hypothetical protein
MRNVEIEAVRLDPGPADRNEIFSGCGARRVARNLALRAGNHLYWQVRQIRSRIEALKAGPAAPVIPMPPEHPTWRPLAQDEAWHHAWFGALPDLAGLSGEALRALLQDTGPGSSSISSPLPD